AGIERLIEIMARLRAPDGCPWDRQQDFRSIAPYTIEEACEVADAIEKGDLEALRHELGDLLLQVVYHARMAEEEGVFAFDDVVGAICDKMVRRHPHVFDRAPGGPPARAENVDWEAMKAAEREAAGARRASVLDDVPAALPALSRALKLTRRAATVGFDWTDPGDVLAKLTEEAGELVAEIGGGDRGRIEEEYGDLMFVLANLARHLSIDPEAALRRANAKFERRFREVESRLRAGGRDPAGASLAEMDRLWNQVKAGEKARKPG
ncbi:MAG TPA: nucleoside triphosphate pyrophosphohydrolase, partial [Thermohalobaculum sp.]|nr:nucleoside triphosphate pyrophosphohydrolase [Thermohalobaculum sp.]